MYIHTVYRPEEHADHLEDWLKYHTQIGVTQFYLYDNGGSTGYGKNSNNVPWDPLLHTDSASGITRYDFRIKYSPEEAREREQDFISKYPVTKIKWQRKQDNKVIYAYNDSVINLLKNVKRGLCAFIDVDEYIVKKEKFKPSRLTQRVFKDYHYFDSVFDCKEQLLGLNINKIDSKCIIDLSDFPGLDDENKYPSTMHFFNANLPVSKSYYNHFHTSQKTIDNYVKIHNLKIKDNFPNCFTINEQPFNNDII